MLVYAAFCAWSGIADLFQHAHEIIEQIFLHDLAVLVPVRNSTKVYAEALVCGLNDRSVGDGHRPFHRATEIGNRARPFALRQHDLVRNRRSD